MKRINNYIIEKLKINKNSKSQPKNPETMQDIKIMVETYFWEWVNNDEMFKVSNLDRENMKSVYDYIMNTLKEKKYNFKKFIRNVLPAAFRRYMNKTYNLTIDEKF